MRRTLGSFVVVALVSGVATLAVPAAARASTPPAEATQLLPAGASAGSVAGAAAPTRPVEGATGCGTHAALLTFQSQAGSTLTVSSPDACALTMLAQVANGAVLADAFDPAQRSAHTVASRAGCAGCSLTHALGSRGEAANGRYFVIVWTTRAGPVSFDASLGDGRTSGTPVGPASDLDGTITRLALAGHRIRRACDGVHEILAGRTATVTASGTGPVRFQAVRSGGKPLASAGALMTNGAARWQVRFPHLGRYTVSASALDATGAVAATRTLVVDVVSLGGMRLAHGGVRLNVPYHRQQYRLSCEAATLRMAVNFFRPRIASDAIAQQLIGVDPRPPRNGGCDPYSAFCGNVAGFMFRDGYGVHDGPVAAAATKLSPCRPAVRLHRYTPATLARYLDQGYPVIVWGAHPSSRSPVRPVRWRAWNGRDVLAWSIEHTWTVAGFTGPASNPRSFVVHDPKLGTRTVSAAALLGFARPFQTAVVVRGA